MTRDDILSEPAGPRMDAWVAELLGCQIKLDRRTSPFGEEYEEPLCGCPSLPPTSTQPMMKAWHEATAHGPHSDDPWHTLRAYSFEIAQAHLALAAFPSRFFELTRWSHSLKWSAVIGPGKDPKVEPRVELPESAWTDEPALAICRVALLAKAVK